AAEARRQPAADAAVPVRADVALEPARKLLYRVARAGGDHPALQSLRETFDLDLQASESEIAHAQGSLSGHNRALLDTVSAAIKEDLLRVKDALDLHLRTGQGDVSALRPQAGARGTIADTLGMLGLEAARNLVSRQRDALEGILGQGRGVAEGELLDIRPAPPSLGASPEEPGARLGGPDAGTAHTAASQA